AVSARWVKCSATGPSGDASASCRRRSALAVVVVLLPVAGPRWWPTGPAPLAIDGLAADHAGRVRAAAAHAERLRQLAEASPEGPVAEHFTHLADTAAGYVHALRDTLAQADIAGAGAAGPALRADADRIVAQLRELELAAERLRAAARRRLETSPLEELTERTRRLTEAIEAPSIDVPTD
ncbi:MAG: hypothetical protein AAFN30_20435, partial [Actinomycetota bacterium]